MISDQKILDWSARKRSFAIPGRLRRLLPTLAFLFAAVVTLSGTVARTSAAPGGANPAPVSANRSCDPCPAVTTDRLNLRKGPGTSYKVIAVIPAETEVLVYAGQTNGFRQVEYGNLKGWARGDCLQSPDAPNWIGLAATDSRVNFRAGPGQDRPVLAVMPAYGILKVSDLVVDGYRYVASNGNLGWAYDDYLYHCAGVVATRALAIRAEPRAGSTYRGTIPAGESATAFMDGDNGYTLIVYGSKTGWVLGRYLS
ncbi:MAG TPA: SH3 domain-containing protein [Thermomicrobiales bacterium]|jgi:uncharacterized protein YraI